MKQSVSSTSSPAIAPGIVPSIKSGRISIPVERRQPGLLLHHGMKVTILGEDPTSSSRYMVQIAGSDRPVSLSKEIVREES